MKTKKHTTKQSIKRLEKVTTQNYVKVQQLNEVIIDLQKIIMALPDFEETISKLREQSKDEEE
mgnify:CR=1 FL=1